MKNTSSKLRLPQRDIISLLLVSLITSHTLWLVLDFYEMNNAGERLLVALSLTRYHNVKQIILEFAQGIEDKHLDILGNQKMDYGCTDMHSSDPLLVDDKKTNVKAFSRDGKLVLQ